MPTIVLSNYAQALRNRREITTANALSLRRQIWTDHTISTDDVEMLFTLDMECPSTSAEWKELFVEALSDYVVHRMEPAGVVDEAKAQWLINRIGPEGHVVSEAEMELLIRVMEHADPMPETLRMFVLSHVAKASKGTMSQADFALLRQAVYNQTVPALERKVAEVARLTA